MRRAPRPSGDRARLRRGPRRPAAAPRARAPRRARGSRPWCAATVRCRPSSSCRSRSQLCSALHYLAAEGVVHLDLKPANTIMSGPPRLIDLSVAVTPPMPRRSSAGRDRRLHGAGAVRPGRARPGRRGGRRLGPRARRSTGRRPASGRSPAATRVERAAERAGRSCRTTPDPGPLPAYVAEPVLACLAARAGARGRGPRSSRRRSSRC